MDNLPFININCLYHVGFMDISHKEPHSQEGSGLSVSEVPNAWMRIAKLGGRPFYRLEKTPGVFLDFYALTDEQLDSIVQWGISQAYIIPAPLYRVTYYDEEGCTYYADYADYEKALEEIDEEEDSVETVNGYIGTEKLSSAVQGIVEPISCVSYTAILYAEEVLDVDGVFWDETLDVYSYSAPRAVIFNHKIENWDKEEVDETATPDYGFF